MAETRPFAEYDEPLGVHPKTCLSWSAFRVSQRHRIRCHPGPSLMPQENKSKEEYLVPAPKARLYRKVLIEKCLPGCAEGPYQGQPLVPPKMLLKTYLVPGGNTRLSARHVWTMQTHPISAQITWLRGGFHYVGKPEEVQSGWAKKGGGFREPS